MPTRTCGSSWACGAAATARRASRYTIRIGHQNGGFRGLTHAAMYEPARETLRRGFLARASECGYAITTYLGPLEPETLADGDVVISFGTNGPYVHGFTRVAIELRHRPISFISYETEPLASPAKKAHHLLERNGKGGMMSELWGYSKAGNTFQVRTKSTRIKFVPPGYVERFPTPVTTPGPVRVFKWLGMRGRCMDRLPVDIRSRVSESYGVKTTQDWARTMAANHTAYLNLHKMHCPRFGGGLASHALPAEYFRLSAILSAGGWWSRSRATRSTRRR